MKLHVTRKRLVVGAVGLLVLAWVASAIRSDPVEVETTRAVRGPMQVSIAAEGRTRVRDRFVVGAPVAGRLERITVREGTPVRQGDVVAQLAPLPLDESAARQAAARLHAARALLAEAATHVHLATAAARQAQRDLERAQVLAEAGALSRRALEEAELARNARTDDVRAARARVVAGEASVEEASAAMLHERANGGAPARVPVRAPGSGRVLRVPDRSERIVAAGTPLVEIGDTRGLEVIADLLSSDAARVKPGMPVTITGWGGEQVLRGQVRLVEPAAATRISALGVEEQRVNVIIDVGQAPLALGDGYRIDADIVVLTRESAVTVPPGALVRTGAEWGVYAVSGGRARLRRVAIGAAGDAEVEVLGGLSAGDVVVAFPSDKVRDGVRVQVRR